jgi:hypothetical protein
VPSAATTSLSLSTWYALSMVSASPERLVARFVPDHFAHQLETPVLTLTIDSPSQHAAAENSLERFREEYVVEVSVAPKAVELWAEYDDEPARLAGARVQHTWSRYTAEDLFQIAKAFDDQLSVLHAENARLHKGMKELELFVGELIRRAETKKSLTHKSTTAADAQIDALQRILNQLTGPN